MVDSLTTNSVDRDMAFEGLNIDDGVGFLAECVLSVFSKFVSHKVVTVRNKGALWMIPAITRMILDETKIYRSYVKNSLRAIDY